MSQVALTRVVVLAPKLRISQFFKGHAYEREFRAYGFCLNNQQANLLLFLGVIFSKTESNYYIPEICKNSKTIPLKIHKKKTTVEFTLVRSFSVLQRRMPPFFCLTCSSDVPLQIINALSHGIKKRNQTKCAAKALWMLILSVGPRCHHRWRHHISRNGYLPDWQRVTCMGARHPHEIPPKGVFCIAEQPDL